jgi:hypothetical protein
MDDIRNRCDANGVKLVVIFIPTEFSSYKDEIVLNPNFPAEARKGVEDEESLFDTFHSTLRQKNITTIDIRKPLQDAVRRGERVYPVNDGHPNNHGNQVIATYISEQLSIINAQ